MTVGARRSLTSTVAMGALFMVVGLGCGGSVERRPPPTSRTPPTPTKRRTPVAVRDGWCPKVPALSSHWPGAVMGAGVTWATAARANHRYGLLVLRNCPAVTGIGISTVWIATRLERHQAITSARAHPGGHDFVFIIDVRTASAAPRGAMFLDGVPVYFVATGPFNAF